jgi:hypothetical protein
MQAVPTTPVRGRSQLDFPRLSVPNDPTGRSVVAGVDPPDGVTVTPHCRHAARAGTPCIIDYLIGTRRVHISAITVDRRPGRVVMQLHTADQRRFLRHRRPITMTIEVPHTNLGVIEGIIEDIALGGLRSPATDLPATLIGGP